MVKTLSAQQDNFKIIEDVENIDHHHRYILKLYDEISLYCRLTKLATGV
jgi:hypothetical protein